MSILLDVLSLALLLGGGAFLLIGAAGLLRMPEFYTRAHAASVVDTLGVALMLAGMIVQSPDLLTAMKLLLVLVFLLLTGPTATHALAKSARHGHLDSSIAQTIGEAPPAAHHPVDVPFPERDSASPRTASGAGVDTAGNGHGGSQRDS